MLEMIISFLLGVLASVAAWIVTTKVIVPKIEFSEEICNLEDEYQDIPIPRFALINIGRRRIFDISIYFRVKITGLEKNRSDAIEAFNIPVGTQVSHIARLIPKKRLIMEINANDCVKFGQNIFPQEIRYKYERKVLTLEDVLSLGTKANAQIIAYGYDEFSGARKYFESKVYTKYNIKYGRRFKKGSVETEPIPVEVEYATSR
jgi:hypothetical protein